MKSFAKNTTFIALEMQFDIDVIDSMIDDLSRDQFALLGWLACGKSLHEIADTLHLDELALESDVDEIKRIFEVQDIRQAESLYSFWIQDFERKLKQSRDSKSGFTE